jgi:hypothetical protein
MSGALQPAIAATTHTIAFRMVPMMAWRNRRAQRCVPGPRNAGYDRAVAKRKAFDPFSPELLVASLVVGVGLLWLVKRAAAPKDPGTPAGVDDQGRPIPPIPPID